MIQRVAKQALTRMADENPIVLVTGPRQSGKTTLVRATFPDKPYVALNSNSTSALAKKNYEKFISAYPTGAIIDDAHICPDLVTYIFNKFSASPENGLFIVISPIYFKEFEAALKGLGREAAVLRLTPLSFSEIKSAHSGALNLSESIYYGSYPPVCFREASPYEWFSKYIDSLVERDLRHVVNVRNISAFSSFIRSCAAHSGYLVNQSELAYECGVTHNTARAWIEALEENHIVFRLYPHSQTFGRRTVKSPKLYFYDTGLAAFLLGINDAADVMTNESWRFLFENFVISELIKTRYNSGLSSNLYYWCDSVGNEISALIERGEALIPIMLKPSHSVSDKDASFLTKWRKLNNQPALPAGVVYCGQEQIIVKGITVYPWHEIGEFGPRFSGSIRATSRK